MVTTRRGAKSSPEPEPPSENSPQTTPQSTPLLGGSSEAGGGSQSGRGPADGEAQRSTAGHSVEGSAVRSRHAAGAAAGPSGPAVADKAHRGVVGGDGKQSPAAGASVDLIGASVAILAWMICSSYLILLHKRILVDEGFQYPLALTGMGQIFQSLAGNPW